MKYVPYPPAPTVTIIFGVALATTKLNNHCVAAARPTFIALSLALGISET